MGIRARRVRRLQLTSVLTLAAAVSPVSARAQDAGAVLPDSVAAYLDSALVVMQHHVIGGDTVDWAGFRARVFERAAGAERPVDTHRTLRWALGALNPHSFLQTSEALRALELERHPEPDRSEAQGERAVVSPFSGRRTPAGRTIGHGRATVGYVAVPAFGRRHLTAFADSIEGLIREQDAAGACAWVVDLRGNGGGNMWPMLAGLGPLLRNGTIGEFHSMQGKVSDWFHEDGVTGIDPLGPAARHEVARVSGPGYRLDRQPPVAVLFDGGTGSSGEASAIAFIGRAETRSFGVESYGFTTANQGFELPDGANMVLTVGVNADRNGTPYPTALSPDEPVALRADGTIPAEPPPVAADAQLQAALAWLSARPACR